MATLTTPLLPAYRQAPVPNTPSSCAEIAALVDLAASREAYRIAIGSGRDTHAAQAAADLASAWTERGRAVAQTLTWPETAASWLRPATRYAGADADLWVMFGPPLGWAQMTRRLLWSTPLKPATILLAGALSDTATLALVGSNNLVGAAGVTRDGQVWRIDDDGVIR